MFLARAMYLLVWFELLCVIGIINWYFYLSSLIFYLRNWDPLIWTLNLNYETRLTWKVNNLGFSEITKTVTKQWAVGIAWIIVERLKIEIQKSDLDDMTSIQWLVGGTIRMWTSPTNQYSFATSYEIQNWFHLELIVACHITTMTSKCLLMSNSCDLLKILYLDLIFIYVFINICSFRSETRKRSDDWRTTRGIYRIISTIHSFLSPYIHPFLQCTFCHGNKTIHWWTRSRTISTFSHNVFKRRRIFATRKDSSITRISASVRIILIYHLFLYKYDKCDSFLLLDLYLYV